MARGAPAQSPVLLAHKTEQEHAPILHLLMVGQTVWAVLQIHRLVMKGLVQVCAVGPIIKMNRG